jgi:DNA polymerase
LQNLPQNHISTLDEARELVKLGCFDMVESIYGNTPDILSQLIRTMLIPKEGCEFIVADFSAIEARVLAWLAGEQWRMDAFKRGDDIYCASASQMFGVPVVKHGINGELRQKGKVAELACGYGGAAGALISMGALDMGLSEDELPGLIDDWRTANPHIVQFWWDVEKAAMDTVKDHRERNVGRIGFQFYANTLWVVLPSGRKLAYIKPRLQPNRFGRMAMTFESLNAANKWSRGETYSGKLVENCTQSTARDLLAEAMWRMEQTGLDIVGHVHDEVILEIPKGTITVEDVCSIMNQNPVWANGLVLSSAGYRGDYYFKD